MLLVIFKCHLFYSVFSLHFFLLISEEGKTTANNNYKWCGECDLKICELYIYKNKDDDNYQVCVLQNN